MAPRLTLYGFTPSQNAVRPELALPEKGLSFEKVEVDLLAGEHQRPPLSDINPGQPVPTLVYQLDSETVVLYESLAIARFIDNLFPSPP